MSEQPITNNKDDNILSGLDYYDIPTRQAHEAHLDSTLMDLIPDSNDPLTELLASENTKNMPLDDTQGNAGCGEVDKEGSERHAEQQREEDHAREDGPLGGVDSLTNDQPKFHSDTDDHGDFSKLNPGEENETGNGDNHSPGGGIKLAATTPVKMDLESDASTTKKVSGSRISSTSPPRKSPTPAKRTVTKPIKMTPKDEMAWVPAPAEIVWTRLDRSRSQALGIIVKRPKFPEYDQSTPSVYCDVDKPDRYLVAFINSDAHVYPPRHYLKKFDLGKALELKCCKNKMSTLRPWEKQKRKAIRDVQMHLQGEHTFESSHNFRKCCTCCDEGEDGFWQGIKLERGTVHIEMKEEFEEQRRQALKEAEKRERKAEERAVLLASKKAGKFVIRGRKQKNSDPVSSSSSAEEGSADEAEVEEVSRGSNTADEQEEVAVEGEDDDDEDDDDDEEDDDDDDSSSSSSEEDSDDFSDTDSAMLSKRQRKQRRGVSPKKAPHSRLPTRQPRKRPRQDDDEENIDEDCGESSAAEDLGRKKGSTTSENRPNRKRGRLVKKKSVSDEDEESEN